MAAGVPRSVSHLSLSIDQSIRNSFNGGGRRRLKGCLHMRDVVKGCSAESKLHSSSSRSSDSSLRFFNERFDGFFKSVEAGTQEGGIWGSLPGGDAKAAALFSAASLHATVHPDLPPVNQLQDPASTSTISAPSLSLPSQTPIPDQSCPWWQVRTVAAQVRSEAEVAAKMLLNVHEMERTGGRGGALLLLSGGHPLRKSAAVQQSSLSDCFRLLTMGCQMRANGQLPSWLQLWAVANPLVDSPGRIEQKIEHGAEGIILQPPLLPERFHDWWSEVTQRGLTSSVPFIIGVPIITSVKNLRFWMQLTEAEGSEARAIEALFMSLQAKHEKDPAEWEEQKKRWNMKYFDTARMLKGSQGMHVMPVSKVGWKSVASFLADNP